MSFFQGASNVTINGGEFNNIKGNYTVYNQTRHETNFGSKNTNASSMYNSNNDNSQRNSGRMPHNRPGRSRQDDEEMDWTPTGNRRENYTRSPPPPERPQYMPQPAPLSGGGNIINTDSYNVNNTHVDDAFNDNSRTYHHGARGSATNQRRRDQPQNTTRRQEDTIPDDEDLQSNSGSYGSLARGPKPGQNMGTGMRSSPSIMVENPNIQHMNQEMRQTFGKLMQQTRSAVENGVSSLPVPVPGNNDETYGEDDADSSSSHSVEAQDRMNTKMADLSLQDPSSSPRSGNKSHPPHLYPPQIASMNKSDPQIPAQTTTTQDNNDIGSSNPSNLGPYNNVLQHSHSTPSVAPHMKVPAMINFIAQSNAAHQDQPNTSEYQGETSFEVPNNSQGKGNKGTKKKGFWGKVVKMRNDSESN